MADNITIIDTASPWLASIFQNSPAWKRKALKSVGWFMQKQIKEGIKSGAPGGQSYKATMPADKRKKLEQAFGNEVKSRYPLMGRLGKAVGYQYKPNSNSVETGWLSNSAASIGSVAEGGGNRSVSEAMRIKFAIAGIPIPQSKNTIVIPERPTFGPMYRVLDPKLVPYMEQKIFDYIDKGAPESVKSKRTYAVFAAG